METFLAFTPGKVVMYLTSTRQNPVLLLYILGLGQPPPTKNYPI